MLFVRGATEAPFFFYCSYVFPGHIAYNLLGFPPWFLTATRCMARFRFAAAALSCWLTALALCRAGVAVGAFCLWLIQRSRERTDFQKTPGAAFRLPTARLQMSRSLSPTESHGKPDQHFMNVFDVHVNAHP